MGYQKEEGFYLFLNKKFSSMEKSGGSNKIEKIIEDVKKEHTKRANEGSRANELWAASLMGAFCMVEGVVRNLECAKEKIRDSLTRTSSVRKIFNYVKEHILLRPSVHKETLDIIKRNVSYFAGYDGFQALSKELDEGYDEKTSDKAISLIKKLKFYNELVCRYN